MEMLAFPNIKTCRNGKIGEKGCRQKKGMLGKLADIDVSAQHVANMSPTFPTKMVDDNKGEEEEEGDTGPACYPKRARCSSQI